MKQTFKYKVSSGAMTRTSTPLITMKGSKAPVVYFTDYAIAQLTCIVDHCKDEVGWYGLVDKDGDNYVITELFVPEQEVSGTTTDIEPEAMGKLAAEIEAAGKDSSKLRYWGHSHVNMAVRPSATDEDQIQEYLDHVDWFIRGIHNKKREVKIDVYDVAENIVHQCCESGRYSPALSTEDEAELKATILANVKTKVYGYPGGIPKGGYGYNGRSQPHVRGNNFQNQKHNNAASNQKQIDSQFEYDDYDYEYYYGAGNVSNFRTGEEKDNLIALQDKKVVEFLNGDLEFFKAFAFPFAYLKECIENDNRTSGENRSS